MSSNARRPAPPAEDARAARRARRSLARGQGETGARNGEVPMDIVVDLISPDNSPPPRSSDAVAEGKKREPEEPEEEDVDEDDLCPICRLLLHNPVTTECNHTLCRFCMATWASVSLAAPMTIVDVDEEPVPFDAVSDLEARCPMCRTMTRTSANPERAARLARSYPRTYAEREAEIASEGGAGGEYGGEGGSGSRGVQTITVYIGNRHRLLEAAQEGDHAQNRHEWTFFVRPSRTDIVEEIQMHLHPTFRPSSVVRQRSPYQISRVGWGAFAVTAEVVLKPGYAWVSEDARDSPDGAAKGTLPLEWMLDFDGFGGKGSMGRCRLKVRSDREDWDGVSDEEGRMDERELSRMRRQYELDGRYEP
ncbi:hypothetical protein BX600DRAFT_512579 [Xylariales sp. PMI_506]|nr:hypothetical protein BX600DRAFT_512579 [Xylariales sp. PMI_506]